MNKTKLTQAQKQAYLESGGSKCPYCGSDDITSGESEYYGSENCTNVDCNSCGEHWWDIWTLTSIDDE